MAEPQMSMQPPNNGGSVATAADFPDDIREIGDTIAGLTLLQTTELVDYIRNVHGVGLEFNQGTKHV